MSIKINNLSHIYNKNTEIENTALKNVSINLSEHFFTGLIGKTGAGKSSLVQHLNFLLQPSKGNIDIDDIHIDNTKKCKRKLDLISLRRNIGFLFQFSENQLFEDSVIKDVMVSCKNFKLSEEESKKLAEQALNLVGLDLSFYERSVFDLSGGEKRKVALAGVIVNKPKYLILDEPTSGLDGKSKNEFITLIKKLFNEGISILLISHDMDLIYECCNDIILMNDGEVIYHLPSYEMFEKNLSQYNILKPKIFDFCSKFDNKYKYAKSINELIEDIKNG